MWWKSPACAPGWFYTRESRKYPEDAERDLQKVHIKKVKPQSSQMMTHCGTKDMCGKLLLPRTTFFSASITSCALAKVSLRRAMFSGMYRLLWVLQRGAQKPVTDQYDGLHYLLWHRWTDWWLQQGHVAPKNPVQTHTYIMSAWYGVIMIIRLFISPR